MTLSGIEMSAATLKVSNRLDSTTILMGKMTTLHLEVEKEKGMPGGFTFMQSVRQDGIIPLCGDSVELRASMKCDTTEVSPTRIKISYKIPVQSFDSGTYRLPAFVYRCGPDTAVTAPLTLKVNPVKDVNAETAIDPYPDVQGPEDKSIFDSLPNWFVRYWWIFLVIILLAVVVWWLVRRYKKEGTILKRKPEPTPYEVAMSGLLRLKARKLWEKGMEKEYFTDLTDILRVYLDKRFGINAMEMTSKDIMRTLSSLPDIKDKREYFRQILSMADFVKFAKVRPLPADNILAYDNAVKFVEETKPAPEGQAATDDNGNRNEVLSSGKNGKKKGGKRS